MPRHRRTFRSLLPFLAALALVAAFAASGRAAAQDAPDPVATPVSATAAVATAAEPPGTPAADSYEVRGELGAVIRRHSTDLAAVLALEPSLLANEAFLADYPDLAQFVAAHPEIRRSPRFYVAELPVPGGDDGFIEPLLVCAAFIANLFVVFWLVRTFVEQRRWSRLARTQSEVHNKILERFGTSEALLEYMRTPAGARFLESAPIPVQAGAGAPASPVGRAIASIQAGVVVAAGALGLLLVSGRFEPDTAQGFFALGVIALSVGIGFVGSAVLSIVLSRRLGIWNDPAPVAERPSAAME